MRARRWSLLGCVTLAVLWDVAACSGDDTRGSTHPSQSQSSTDAGTNSSKDAGAEGAAPGSLVDAAPSGPACPFLVNACAPYDIGSGQVHACAKLGQDGDEALCALDRDACRDACATASETVPRDASHIPAVNDASAPPHRDAGPPPPARDAEPPIRTPDAAMPPDAGLNVCQKIGATCSKIDPGTGPVHDCTVLRDSTDLAACNAKLDGCSDLCGTSICVRLGSICHDVDPGSGPLHDCHFGGHAGVASWCFDNAVHCYAICEAAAEASQ